MPAKSAQTSAITTVIFVAAGAIIVFYLLFQINLGVTKKLHGPCVATMEKTMAELQSAIDIQAKNPGDKATVPVSFGDCVIAVVLSNQDTFLDELQKRVDTLKKTDKTDISLETVFPCPKGYQSRLIGVPVPEKSVEGLVDKGKAIGSALFNNNFADVLNWAKQAAGYGLTSTCKSLQNKDSRFKNSKVLEGGASSSGVKRYCIQVTRDKGDPTKFEISAGSDKPITEAQLAQCK